MEDHGGGSASLVALDEAITRAREAVASGRPEDARGEIAVVLDDVHADHATPDERRRRVRALSLLGLVAFETDGTDAALRHLDEAAKEAAAVPDDELVALTWSQRASVLGRSGRMAESLTALDTAAERLDALGGRDRTIVLMNRGVARSQAGDLAGAVADLERAAASAAEHTLPVERFMATHNLGYLHHLLGDVPAALRAMEEADGLDVEISRGVSLLDRGRVLMEAGLIDEAQTALARATEVCRDDGQHQAEAEALYERARAAIVLEQHDDALRLVRDASSRFDARTSPAWVARCRLTELGLHLERLQHADAGEDRADVVHLGVAELADAARRLVDDLADGTEVARRRARALAGEAAALAGDLAGAAALVPTDEAVPPLLTARLDEHRARTTLAVAAGDVPLARQRLREAADDLATASLSATTLDLRTSRLAHAAALARTDLSLAIEDGPVAAIDAIDRWRAASSRLPPVRPDASARSAELLTERRQLRERLRDTPRPSDETWAELAELERRIATERRGAGRSDAGDDGTLADVRAVGAEQLLAALDADRRDLLVTAVLRGRVLVVGTRDGDPFLRDVGDAREVERLARRVRADLRTLTTRAPGPLHGAIRASLDAGAAELATRLLGARAGAVPGRRLLVVAHGGMNGLPWGLLTPERSVLLASSPSAWFRDHASASVSPQAAPSVRVVRGPRLAAATAEADAVSSVWGLGRDTADATAADLVDALRSADLVHVVAHGHHHRQQPLFSSVSLSDGPCCLYDVETSGVTARTVVLASCDTGSATVRPGDEPLGLASGLLALGARSVVAPVCPVPDEVLPQVMTSFHRALAAGAATDDALVTATADEPLAAAAFVVSGAASRHVHVPT